MDEQDGREGQVNPGEVRYIKLGLGGAWEAGVATDHWQHGMHDERHGRTAGRETVD